MKNILIKSVFLLMMFVATSFASFTFDRGSHSFKFDSDGSLYISPTTDDFDADGFPPVKKFSDNKIYDNYYVNRDYKVFKKNGEEYTPVLIKQMNKDGSLNDKDIIANVFYGCSFFLEHVFGF